MPSCCSHKIASPPPVYAGQSQCGSIPLSLSFCLSTYLSIFPSHCISLFLSPSLARALFRISSHACATGQSRKMSDEECRHRGVPAGAFSIIMSKQEIDGAAKDVHNILFPSSLKLEIVFVKLELKGTGPKLKAAVDAGNLRFKYTHVHSRAHAHVHAHAHARTRTHTHTHTHTHTRTRTCTCTHTHTHSRTHARTHTHTHTPPTPLPPRTH